jgi:hypothetical protein
MQISPDDIREIISEWTGDKTFLNLFQCKIIERCQLVEKRHTEFQEKFKKSHGGKSPSEFNIDHAHRILTDEKLKDMDQCPGEGWYYREQLFQECNLETTSDSKKEVVVNGWWPPKPEPIVSWMFGNQRIPSERERLLASYLLLASFHDYKLPVYKDRIITEKMINDHPDTGIAAPYKDCFESEHLLESGNLIKWEYLNEACDRVKADIEQLNNKAKPNHTDSEPQGTPEVLEPVKPIVEANEPEEATDTLDNNTNKAPETGDGAEPLGEKRKLWRFDELRAWVLADCPHRDRWKFKP